MNITCTKDGTLAGKYETSVGDADKTYELVGRYDSLPHRRSLGWTVTWTNKSNSTSKSTTCWCGQFQLDPHTDMPQILTMWLLTTQTKPDDDWNSTHVGHDIFTRCLPAPEQITKAIHQGRISHPKEAAPVW